MTEFESVTRKAAKLLWPCSQTERILQGGVIAAKKVLAGISVPEEIRSELEKEIMDQLSKRMNDLNEAAVAQIVEKLSENCTQEELEAFCEHQEAVSAFRQKAFEPVKEQLHKMTLDAFAEDYEADLGKAVTKVLE